MVHECPVCNKEYRCAYSKECEYPYTHPCTEHDKDEAGEVDE